MQERRILLAVTGASGSVYAQRLLQVLMQMFERIYLVCSESGKQVVEHELANDGAPSSLREILKGKRTGDEKVRLYANDDFFAPFASGSNAATDIVVIPCSMGTLSRVCHGFSSSLLERACDVTLKQKKRLVLVPRETPLSIIHLQNMLRLAQAGAHIVPANPAFYHKPRTLEDSVDFVVSRVLDCLELKHDLSKRWGNRRL